MANIDIVPYRLAADRANPGQIIDLNTNNAPILYRGDDMEFDIAFMQAGFIYTGFANLTGATLQIFQKQNDSNAPVISANLLAAAMNLTLTQAQWVNNTNTGNPAIPPVLPTTYQHAAFRIPKAQTGLNLGGAPSAGFWLRVTLQFTDPDTSAAANLTFLDGPITFLDGPNVTLSAPPPGRFRISTDNAGNVVPQIYDPVTGMYFNLEIDTVGGIRTLALGDTAYS